jgi:hypothetical protein
MSRDEALERAAELLEYATEAVEQKRDTGVLPRVDADLTVAVAVGWLLLADRLEAVRDE